MLPGKWQFHILGWCVKTCQIEWAINLMWMEWKPSCPALVSQIAFWNSWQLAALENCPLHSLLYFTKCATRSGKSSVNIYPCLWHHMEPQFTSAYLVVLLMCHCFTHVSVSLGCSISAFIYVAPMLTKLHFDKFAMQYFLDIVCVGGWCKTN